MSIMNYNKRYVITNGTTNEVITVPKSIWNTKATREYTIDEIMLIDTLLGELRKTDNVTINNMYVKD